MPYYMNIAIGASCFNNGQEDATAASAAVATNPRPYRRDIHTAILPTSPTATSSRAELNALVLALETALERKAGLQFRPRFHLFVKSCSSYVVGIMTEWKAKWQMNGWKDAKGNVIANKDLIERAVQLEEAVTRGGGGFVAYQLVPRKWNGYVNWVARKALQWETKGQ